MISLLERQILGQMTQPPETAISTPLQQAVSNLQSGGRGALPGGFANLPNNGMQTRAQLGLPDRKSYFPGTPSFDEAAALGAFPGLASDKGTVRAARKLGNPITKRERREGSHPELKGKS